jgi:hypothetical protein
MNMRLDKSEVGAVNVSRKELSEAFNVLVAAAKLLEDIRRPRVRVRAKRVMMAKKVEPEEKHLGPAIAKADTWSQRDRLCRRLSSFCYSLAKDFLKAKDFKNAQKWMNLSLRYLRLSMHPKEQFSEEELQKLKDMVEEIRDLQRKESRVYTPA